MSYFDNKTSLQKRTVLFHLQEWLLISSSICIFSAEKVSISHQLLFTLNFDRHDWVSLYYVSKSSVPITATEPSLAGDT